MNNIDMTYNTILTPTSESENIPIIEKKIGQTTYEVSIHFSTIKNETMSDKIKRLIKHDMNV